MGKTNTELISRLREFKSNVTKKYGIKKIILFGSQATGKATKDSDVDLIIVTKNGKMKVWPKLYYEWHMNLDMSYPVDFLCYTPKEFERLKKKVSIVSEALREGIAI